MALPRNMRIEFRIGIFPPPDFVTLPVPAEDDVGMAVAVHVADNASGLDGKEIGLDNEALPSVADAPIPNQRRRALAEAQDKSVDAVVGKIADKRAGLLGGRARFGQIVVGR